MAKVLVGFVEIASGQRMLAEVAFSCATVRVVDPMSSEKSPGEILAKDWRMLGGSRHNGLLFGLLGELSRVLHPERTPAGKLPVRAWTGQFLASVIDQRAFERIARQ
jgi:hypothetical protein